MLQPEFIDLVNPGEPQPVATPAQVEFDNNENLPPLNERHFAFPAEGKAEQNVTEPPSKGQIYHIDGEDVFIPDDEAEAEASTQHPVQPFTAETCLTQVLEIFPDIQHDHVRKLYCDFDTEEVSLLSLFLKSACFWGDSRASHMFQKPRLICNRSSRI
jgi:hypothetical protein